MKNRKTILLLFCFLLNLNALKANSASDTLKQVLLDLYSQILVFPQEKAYLQTDRPHYISGEKIFFRVFLQQAHNRRPAAISRYVYVELISPVDTVVSRKMIRIDEQKMYYGHLLLPKSLPEGNYRLRCYTRFMENLGEAAFYNRYVYIADPNVHKAVLTPTLSTNETNQFESHTYNNDNIPQLEFYPEGGSLIAGCENRIAFKALLPGAKSINVSGEVYNGAGTSVTTFKTLHEGMGSFRLTPLANEKYTVRWTYQQQTYENSLPKVIPNALALTANWEKDSLAISIKHTNLPTQRPYYLFIHRQGTPLFLQTWDFSKNQLKRPLGKFATGVTHLMLLDSQFAVISERMVFVNRRDETKLNITPSSTLVKTRERVDLSLQVMESIIDSILPSCAVTVFDDKDVQPDTTTNIIAEFLLSSELKGMIHYPLWYFGSDKNVAEAADLLMLTHGWRQYYITEALVGDIKKPLVKPETSQTLTGVLKKPIGTSYPKANIKMSALGYSYSDVVQSNAKGAYEFTGFEFPDSTTYFFITQTKKKSENIVIHPDKPSFPAISPDTISNVNSVINDQNYKNRQHNFVTKAERKLRIENGIWQMDLAEVTISARNLESLKFERIDNHLVPGIKPDRTISRNDLEESPPITMEELLWRIPGVTDVTVVPPDVSVTIRGGNAIFLINGIPTQELESAINVQDIAQVDVYMESSATLLYTSNRLITAVIAFTTSPPGAKPNDDAHMNKKAVKPLGYQTPQAFYSPEYDSPGTIPSNFTDLRTTIYWKPDLVFDENGYSNITIYTADTPTTYSIIVEGFGVDKKLIYEYKKSFIKVKSEQ